MLESKLTKNELKFLYLDLVKSSVLNLLYLENEFNPIQPRGRVRPIILKLFQSLGIQLCHAHRSTPEERINGVDHTSIAHTMVSIKRLNNVLLCIDNIIADGVDGDFIETGVLRGGCSILMKAALKAHGITDRDIWLADSFKGLPPPNSEKYPADSGATWHLFLGGEASLEHVKRNFDRYGLLDNHVRFLEGWFRDTLPVAPIEQLALIRLDGDLYESTMDSLVNLYPKLAFGGFLIIDDYYLDGCRQAIHDYRSENGISDTIIDIDGAGAYWRRTNL